LAKRTILIGHLVVFVVGAIALVVYFATRMGALSGVGGAGATVALPVVAVVYVIGFGIFCLVSLGVWLLVRTLRGTRD
jgi:F0F1-type ATP synthase assembly protein I